MKKLLVFGVIVLFLSVSVIPSTGTTDVKQSTMPTPKGDTLYVGGSGPNNYTKIQDAIDDSSNGDTVYVYDDSSPYYENVVVDKSIELHGENRDTTVVDGNGSGSVFKLDANIVKLHGFTIQHGTYGIRVFSNLNVIRDNKIINIKEDGILLDVKTIYGNESNLNIISGNIIMKNGMGITVLGEFPGIAINGCSNIIRGNTIINNSYGVTIFMAHLNILCGNNISNNEEEGIDISLCLFTIVVRNNVAHNGEYGIVLGMSIFTIIRCNNFIENGCDAYFVGMAIPLFGRFIKNYWGRPRLLPKIISGEIFTFPEGDSRPWFIFDFRPSRRLYDIGV